MELANASPSLLVVTGTGVPSIAKSAPYRNLSECGGGLASIEVLPFLGLGHATHSLDVLSHRYFENREDRIDILGHSQGGLIALALANRYPEKVGRVVTFGAPFKGTTLAPSWAPLAAARCMARDSRWLRRMVVPRDVEVHSFFTPDDKLVIPFTSSVLVGANNHYVAPTPPPAGIGWHWIASKTSHVGLVNNPAVLEEVRDILCRVIEVPRSPSPLTTAA